MRYRSTHARIRRTPPAPGLVLLYLTLTSMLLAEIAVAYVGIVWGGW